MTRDVDKAENSSHAPSEMVTMLNGDVTTHILAIIAEATDYTKISLDNRLAFVEKLVGAKSFDSAFRIQSEYAKTSFEGFVAEATKMGELYSNLAKVTFKPFESGDRSKTTPGH